MTTMTKRLYKLAAGALLTLGVAASASAAPTFTVDPNSNGFATLGTIFQAESISGDSSVRIFNTGGTTYGAVGYIRYTGFAGVTGTTSRVNFDYGLYATFSQTFTCSALLSPGVSCSVDTISLSLLGDPGNDNIYNLATLGSNASVTTVGGQVLLGTVDTVIAGVAGLNALGGAAENVTTNFDITAAGALFFTSPDPFYNISFSAFNNTSQGPTCDTAGCVNATIVAVTSESGTTDFNLAVPEPGPLALLGIGLLGLMVSRRKSHA